MKKKTILLLFASLFIHLSYTCAQIGTFYTTDNELSSSLINSIYQDRRDYLWIATEDGLNKFDGVKFTIYKNRPNDPTTIKNNYVRSLFEDSKGRFWIGCINGLHLYDRATDNFKEVELFHGDSLITPHITSIIESKDNEIWMTTSGLGVVRIKQGDLRCQTDMELSDRLSSMHLTCIFQDSQENFWIASENQGLNLYNPKTDKFVVFKAPHSIGSNQIVAVCEDSERNLFVGTLTNGLYKLNAEKQQFEIVPHINNAVLSVKSLLIDNENRLLVGTDGQGMKIYNKEKQILEDYQTQSAPFDFSKMKVHAICQDKTGNVWTGLFQKGVFLDPKSPNNFKYLGNKSFYQNLIGSGCVMSLIVDKDKSLWIGTDNDGVYKLDNKGRSKHFAPSAGRNSLPNTVLSMVEDDDGNIWLGSYLKGLACLNKQSGQCTNFDHYNSVSDDDNTARDKIFSLAKDKQNRLWIGTNGAGIYVFDLKEKKYINHYSQSGVGTQYLPNNWINCIISDNEGIIWVGSYNGVFCINPDTGDMQHYTIENSQLPGSVVYCITEDSKGRLWIGTTEGLACFSKENKQSVFYTTTEGLPSNVICGILEDEQGNVWMSTHSGVSKFVVDENKFINFYASDGLQGNEFSLGAMFKSSDGAMFFGGINGVSTFFPSEINDQRTPLNLCTTALYVMDKVVFSGQKSGRNEIISGFIADVDTIRLTSKDNMFALEFSTFDFGFSERVYYQYMLEGLNSQWMTTEQGVNRINFTNISHGTYKLHVKAAIYNNSSEEKIITLIITPPWYLTWWAKLLWFLLSAFLVFGIARFILDRIRHKNELMRSEHAEQISEAKLQFFINVSHEIRTPMTLVMNPLEKLIAENKDADKQKVYLLMYRNAQRILRLINQLMDVRKLDKGLMSVSFRETDMVGFIDDVMQTFEYQANRRNIDFKFIHPDKHLKVWVDMNNFDKVLVNILSNAFKFTPEDGEIIVSLQTGSDNAAATAALRNYFEIIVSDTGTGIEEDKIEKIFERFYQINSNEPSGFGTGIGLHLSRSLVELQHGQIYARNRKDRQGSEFVIRLPLGSEHLNNTEKSTESIASPQKMKPEISMATLVATGESGAHIVKSKTKYRVLIVDDEDEIRHYLKDELSEMYRITEAVNGKEALNIILREKPDLVISDVMMPEMDGKTLVKKMKSNINVNHIPIVLLTAKASDEDKAEGFETGADAYISKPFSIDLLKIRIANMLENRERLEHKAVDPEENKSLIKPIVLRSSDQILYEKIIKIINENISDPDLNVEFLANGVGMSRVHMHRKLKEMTNQSARDFIRFIRLKQAGDLLTGQKLTVSEVAYALGFCNLSHFSNSFREFHGMSPKEYAEQSRKENQSPTSDADV